VSHSHSCHTGLYGMIRHAMQDVPFAAALLHLHTCVCPNFKTKQPILLTADSKKNRLTLKRLCCCNQSVCLREACARAKKTLGTDTHLKPCTHKQRQGQCMATALQQANKACQYANVLNDTNRPRGACRGPCRLAIQQRRQIGALLPCKPCIRRGR